MPQQRPAAAEPRAPRNTEQRREGARQRENR